MYEYIQPVHLFLVVISTLAFVGIAQRSFDLEYGLLTMLISAIPGTLIYAALGRYFNASTWGFDEFLSRKFGTGYYFFIGTVLIAGALSWYFMVE